MYKEEENKQEEIKEKKELVQKTKKVEEEIKDDKKGDKMSIIKEEKKEIINEINKEVKEEKEEKEITQQNIKENEEGKSKENIFQEKKEEEKNDGVIKKEKENLNIKEGNEDELEEDEEIYADNVFLSSSPLPCVTVYISQKRIFRTYTINGEFVAEEKEEDEQGSRYIKCPLIFKNLYFQDFLIYGTDKGYVKIRAFPKMNLIGKIHATPGYSIEALEISKDKRYCYIWSRGNDIIIVKNQDVYHVQVYENISRMGFNIGH